MKFSHYYFLILLCFSVTGFSPRLRLYKKHHSSHNQRNQRNMVNQLSGHFSPGYTMARQRSRLCSPTTCVTKCLVTYSYNTDGNSQINSHCPTNIIFRICCQWSSFWTKSIFRKLKNALLLIFRVLLSHSSVVR